MERVEGALGSADPASRTELERITRHLALHDQAEVIVPSASVWRGLEQRLVGAPARPRSFLHRFRLPLAAAALMVAALAWKRPVVTGGVETRTLFGSLERAADGVLTANEVARLRLGDGVTITLDRGTTLLPLSDRRLVLKTGRIFLEVSKRRRGFVVETGQLTVRTMGTAYLVEPKRVAVESGRVWCRFREEVAEIGAGAVFDPERLGGPAPRDFFSRPSMSARILPDGSLRVRFTNAMPDPITLAPPTGGEPFLFAGYAGRDHALSIDGFTNAVTLEPGGTRSFHVPLPAPAEGRQRVSIACPSLNLRMEATR